MATTHEIRFEDGAAYERYMGRWSRLTGDAFLDWLCPAAGGHWLDVGCGGGAFTELIFERCVPTAVAGIDPSEAQLAYARARLGPRGADFRIGDAMSLPFPSDTFDAAVMPLVIFFVPDPAQGVAEMTRVVRRGGIVTAYGWDIAGGGFPYEALVEEMRKLGLTVPQPPNPNASTLDVLQGLWSGARLDDVEVRSIDVARTFVDFDDYWATILGAPSAGPTLKAMNAEGMASLKAAMTQRLAIDSSGRVHCTARANAVKGRV